MCFEQEGLMTPEENEKIKNLKGVKDIFEHIFNHLLQMKKRSMSYLSNDPKYYSCSYRGDENSICEIGSIISDDEYKKEFEGMNVGSIEIKRIQENIDLLRKLQKIHDQKSNWDDNGLSEAGKNALNDLKDYYLIKANQK